MMADVPPAGTQAGPATTPGAHALLPPRLQLSEQTRALAMQALRTEGPAVAVPWRIEAMRLAATVFGLTAAGVVVVLLFGGSDLQVLRQRLDGVVLLLIAQAMVFTVALSPGWRARAGAAVLAAAAAGLAMVVLGRDDVAAGAASGTWVCASSHATGGMFALALVVMRLRGSVFSWRKALLGGLGVGLSGLIWGEIACAGGRSHVVVEHVGGLLFLTVVCVAASRLIRPRSYAP